ncbi:hypothetical protein F5877DRAFT_77776 [Lentinula edodes]|nr:hypothetical protein F5877DRAFT_77776 [Lentinula edodes]
MASTSWVGEQDSQPHPSAFVQEVDVVLPYGCNETTSALRRAMANIAKHSRTQKLRRLRIHCADVSLADYMSSEIGAPFLDVAHISLSWGTSNIAQRLANRLMANLMSSSLTWLKLDLQSMLKPVDYSTIAKVLRHVQSEACNLRELHLILGSRTSNRPYQRLQFLLDSDSFIFDGLRSFNFSDGREVFNITDFVARHRTLRSLTYFAWVYRIPHQMRGPDIPLLHYFDGSLPDATALLSYPGSRIKTVCLRGPRINAVDWHFFTHSVGLSRSVTTLHLRNRGGCLFRHIETLVSIACPLQDLTVVMAHQWQTVRGERLRNVFSILMHGLPNLKRLGVMVVGEQTDVCAAVQMALTDVALQSPIENTAYTQDLPALARSDSLTYELAGFHPAAYVRYLTVNTGVDKELVFAYFKTALANIEAMSMNKKLDMLSFASRNVCLAEVWGRFVPGSLLVRRLVCRCPLRSGILTDDIFNVFRSLLAHSSCVDFDWLMVDDPPSYVDIAELMKTIHNTAPKLDTLKLAIPPVGDVGDYMSVQKVVDDRMFYFPRLRTFAFEESFGNVSLASFFERHPYIGSIAYCGIHNHLPIANDIRDGRLLASLFAFVGNIDNVIILGGALAGRLTRLTVTSSSSTFIHGNVGCSALVNCFVLQELELTCPTGYNASDLQTISDYVPGISVLRVYFPRHVLDHPNKSGSVRVVAESFYNTIFICFTSLVELEVTISTSILPSCVVAQRAAVLGSIGYRAQSAAVPLAITVNDFNGHNFFALVLSNGVLAYTHAGA